jgi:hypothetical protein
MTSELRTDRSFTPEQVSDIIDTATRLQQLADGETGELTMGQLGEIARELGIDDANLVEAVKTGESGAKASRKVAKRRARWFRNLGRFTVILSALVLIDLVTGGRLSWWIFPAIAFGMALGLQAMSAFGRRDRN